jgi:hypothetical protein
MTKKDQTLCIKSAQSVDKMRLCFHYEIVKK